ncbi:MAG TPA: FesM [Anaerolineae bacterium]
MITERGQPAGKAGAVDILRWPLAGRFLRWRHARLALQAPLFLLAGLMLFDGFFGPQLAPKNLATVGAWLQYRGLVVLALLIAGNLFCMACPFMLPRRLGRLIRRRFLAGGHPVPRALRNKWLAVALTAVFFYVYERYSLWASPWLTAWVAAGYFLAAFLVDTWFEGAAFCKYVCPLGQFNFFGSLVSPLEIRVRAPSVCAACATKDCIRGRRVGEHGPQASPAGHEVRPYDETRPEKVTIPGCELWLFQPAKAGNMDCTFCLDCVHACPHDNIGLIGRLPTAELWGDPFRSGIGRFSRRADLAALVVLLTFASFINAFNMIRPVYTLRDRLAAALGLPSPAPLLLLTFVLGLIVLPALLVALAGWASARLAQPHETIAAAVQRYVYALVPLGFGMWVAHYSFHFLTGGLTIVPVVQSFLADVGLYGGPVQWGLGPVVPGAWLFPIEAVFLYLGATGALIVAFQISQRPGAGAPGNQGRGIAAALPWFVLILLLLAAGLWILVQPMDMRGTMQMIGLPGTGG